MPFNQTKDLISAAYFIKSKLTNDCFLNIWLQQTAANLNFPFKKKVKVISLKYTVVALLVQKAIDNLFIIFLGFELFNIEVT